MRNRYRTRALHKFTFEVRPDTTDLESPGHVSAWAVDVETALRIASRDVPDGWLIRPAGHARGEFQVPRA